MTQPLTTLAKRLVQALRRGAMRRELYSLDDRMLADIGLRRDDIHSVCANAYVGNGRAYAAGTSADLHWLPTSGGDVKPAGTNDRLAA